MDEPIDRHPTRDARSDNAAIQPNCWALGAAAFPGLANPVAFQLLRMPAMTGPMLWVYALCREEGAEFESVARVDPGDNTGSMAELLACFLVSDECAAKVISPLAARVAARRTL